MMYIKHSEWLTFKKGSAGMKRSEPEIAAFLERLKAIWMTVPRWRFGQLICNLIGATGRDPFYVEDGDLIAAMENAVSNLPPPGTVVDNHVDDYLR